MQRLGSEADAGLAFTLSQAYRHKIICRVAFFKLKFTVQLAKCWTAIERAQLNGSGTKFQMCKKWTHFRILWRIGGS